MAASNQTLPPRRDSRTKGGALAPEIGPFSRRISATNPFSRAKIRCPFLTWANPRLRRLRT